MRTLYTIISFLLTWLSFTAAQSSSLTSSIEKLPQCALPCLLKAIEGSPCQLTNQTCICTNAPLQLNVTICVTQSCSIKDALTTKNVTETACGASIRDRSDLYANIAISLGVVSAAAILARIGSKLLVKTEFGPDDYFIFATLMVGIPSTIMSVRGLAANGLGKDVWTLPFEQITDFVHFFYAMEILYFAEVALLKLSLLYFYKRIFPGPIIQRVLLGTIVVDIVYGITFVFIAIFQCKPISYYWKSWDGEHIGQCIDINALGWANAAISIALDAWMLAIPMSQLVHLEMHWKKKIQVGLMFCVGTFVTVISILRLQSLVHFANSSNPTQYQWEVSNWSTVEINVGIICACMPSIRVILVRIFPKILSTGTRRQAYYGNAYGNSKSISKSGRSRDRSGSERLGSRNGEVPDGIMYSKTYDVHFSGEHDETRLVPMEDLEFKREEALVRTAELGR